MSEPKQEGFEFEPETENYAGVKHEWTGTLYVPTASEMERIEKEQAARDDPFERGVKRVKMNFKEALRLRQRGV